MNSQALVMQPVSKGWFLNAHKAVGVVYEIGDNTPRDRIKLIGRESAKSMMRIMLEGKQAEGFEPLTPWVKPSALNQLS